MAVEQLMLKSLIAYMDNTLEPTWNASGKAL